MGVEDIPKGAAHPGAETGHLAPALTQQAFREHLGRVRCLWPRSPWVLPTRPLSSHLAGKQTRAWRG